MIPVRQMRSCARPTAIQSERHERPLTRAHRSRPCGFARHCPLGLDGERACEPATMGSRPKTRCRGREFRCPFSKRVHSAGAAKNHLFLDKRRPLVAPLPMRRRSAGLASLLAGNGPRQRRKGRQLIETVALPWLVSRHRPMHPAPGRLATSPQGDAASASHAISQGEGRRRERWSSFARGDQPVPPGVPGPRTRPPNEDRRLGHCLSRQRSRCGARGLCVRNCRWPLRFTQD
jgi:hypothetical protein